MYDNLIQLFLEGQSGEKVMDSLPIAIVATDLEGRLTYYNSAAVDLAGYEPQLHSDKWWDSCSLLYPDETPVPEEEYPLAATLQKGENLEGTEGIAERPDGQRTWIKAYPSPIHNKKGELIGGINFLLDITDQKENEKLLRKNKQELDDFFENASLGMHLTGSDGIIKRANKAILDMLGYTHEEFVGSHIANFHARENVVDDILQKISDGEDVKEYEVPLRHKDGTIRHVLLYTNGYHKNGDFIHSRCVTRDITSRKKTEAELDEVTAESDRQQRLYKAIISSTPDLMYVFDLDYNFIFANDSLLEMWGLNEKEYYGKSLVEIGYESWHAEMHEREIDQVIATKQPVQGEVSFPHDKLGRRIYEYIFVPVLDDNNKVEAVAGTARDVTNRTQAEENLRKSEEKYRTLFEEMGEGFCIFNVELDDENNVVDLQYLETNPAFEKHSGLKDVEGKKVSETLPDLEDEIYQKYGHVALTGESIQFETYIEELEHWLEVFAFRTGKPEERKVAVLFQNITQRKHEQIRCERLLRQIKIEQERLEDIFQHAPSFMCIHRGPNHVIQRANDLYMKVIGDRKIIDKPVREAFPEIEGQGYFKLLDRVYETGEPYRGNNEKVVFNTGSGKNTKVHYIDFVYQPIRNSKGEVDGIFVQGVDQTERKQARDDLEKVNETLEERVEERTESLLSYQKQLRSLASQLSRSEEQQRRHLATELHDNLGQLLALGKMKIDLLQNSSLSKDYEKAITDLKDVMDDALKYTRRLMTELKPPPSIQDDFKASIEWIIGKLEERGLKVTIEDEDQPKPLSEEVRITLIQSVRELLLNVLKHTSVQEAKIVIRNSKNQLQITVKDKGEGFDFDHAKLNPERDGRFGLFNIQERIDLLGGTVKIKTMKGEGTEIDLYVPLARTETVEEESATSADDKGIPETDSQQISDENIKVLLVDDHQMVRKGFRKIIEEQSDITVIGEAADGKEAIKLAKETSPDVILMDIRMEDMNGVETTKKILRKMPDVRIIGLSLHDEEEASKDMLNAGATAYLNKSEAFESLIVSIRAEAAAKNSS